MTLYTAVQMGIVQECAYCGELAMDKCQECKEFICPDCQHRGEGGRLLCIDCYDSENEEEEEQEGYDDDEVLKPPAMCECCRKRQGCDNSAYIFDEGDEEGVWICEECEEEAISDAYDAHSLHDSIQRDMGGRL